MAATVYACGSGDYLGIQTHDNTFTPVIFEDESTPNPKIFKSVYLSPSFGYQTVLHATYVSFAIQNCIRAYSGAQEAYYVGYCFNDEKPVKKFTRLYAPFNANIIQSACGYYDVAYLTGTLLKHSNGVDGNEIYSRGDLVDSHTEFKKLSIPNSVRVNEIHATFYGFYVVSGTNKSITTKA